MNRGGSATIGVASCIFVAAAILVVYRGGLLAWIGVVLGILLLLKTLFRPSPRDAVLSVAILAIWTLSWGAAWNYVVSTWESGEVVQLELTGGHTARLWVVDMSDGPFMYYDAPPDVARQLLAGAPISVTRNGQVRRGCATSIRVRELPKDRYQEMYDQMEAKYEGRNTATAVFYSVLGGRRDRIGLLIELSPCA